MLSIITPSLNNVKYIEDNILSIMTLTIPHEHIIVDGGSVDGSLDLISKYPHVKLLHQKEKTGMYGAIDQGIKESLGEYVTWINCDDRVVSSGYDFIYLNSGNYDFIYSDGNYFFTNDGHIEFGKGRRFGKFFLRHGCMPSIQPSAIFSKKLYLELGGFRFEKFKICGDLDLFVRMANKKETLFKYIPVLSTIFMKRGNSLGDLNHHLFLKEIKENQMPTPNFFIRVMFFICKYV